MQKNEIIISALIIALLGISVFFILKAKGDNNRETTENAEDTCSIAYEFPAGLDVKTTAEGSGRCAKPGDLISVHYKGTLKKNGNEFDTNVKGQDVPFQFTLGAGQVIRGWDEGLKGAQVGEKRTLTIPAELGYGEAGYPPDIPSNAALVFEVEVVEVTQQASSSS